MSTQHPVLPDIAAIYQQAIHSIVGAGLWVVDHDLRYLIIAGELPAQLKQEPERLIGRPVKDGLAPELVELVSERYRRALQGRSDTYQTEYLGRRIRSRYLPLKNHEGETYAAMAFLIDITSSSSGDCGVQR